MPAPQRAAAITAQDALYPCSDGKPMSDNMWQSWAIINAACGLRVARPDALVAADILVYPEQGNPKNRIAPDVLVAFGLGIHKRPTYLVWQEGKPPDWVLEVASLSTAARDLDAKRHAYAAMGVPEYWLFDPQGDLFPPGTPRLQGLTLARGEYAPLSARLVDGVYTIRSNTLGLDLRADDELIRFRDPATGEDVRHYDEAEVAAKREAARAQRATADLAAAQTRIAELEAAVLRARGPGS